MISSALSGATYLIGKCAIWHNPMRIAGQRGNAYVEVSVRALRLDPEG
jgi:hypothetical protein